MRNVLLLLELPVEGVRVRACEGVLVVEGLAVVLPVKREVVVVNAGEAIVNGGAVLGGGSGEA
jgi:hypothetical protein